jgi:nitrate/nitrite transporter NarK
VRDPVDGWTGPVVMTGLSAGTALLVGFAPYSTRAEHPMRPMRLFRFRAFAGTNAASLMMFLGMFGSIFPLSQYMQGVLGYSPTEAGLRMLPWTGMPMLVAPVAGILSDRIGGRPVVAVGFFLQAAGLGQLSLVATADASYAVQLTALVTSGVGMALFFAPASSLVMSSVRAKEQGIASVPTTRCARSAVRSESPSWRRSSRRRAATSPARRSWTGCGRRWSPAPRSSPSPGSQRC